MNYATFRVIWQLAELIIVLYDIGRNGTPGALIGFPKWGLVTPNMTNAHAGQRSPMIYITP